MNSYFRNPREDRVTRRDKITTEEADRAIQEGKVFEDLYLCNENSPKDYYIGYSTAWLEIFKTDQTAEEVLDQKLDRYNNRSLGVCFDGKDFRYSIPLGDQEWRAMDHAYIDIDLQPKYMYQRLMVCSYNGYCALLTFNFYTWSEMPYEEAKPRLDEFTAALRPIDQSDPNATPLPTDTPDPRHVPLSGENGPVLMEYEGLKLTVSSIMVLSDEEIQMELTTENTAQESQWFAVTPGQSVIINGVKLSKAEFHIPFEVKPNAEYTIKMSLKLSGTSLVGITANQIQEIQVPISLFSFKDNFYKKDKDLGYFVIRISQ